MILLISFLFFGFYLYFKCIKKENKKNIITLSYDDLYHHSKKEKGFVVYLFSFENFDKNIDNLFREKVNKIIEKYEVCKYVKTNVYNQIKFSKNTKNEIFNIITLKGYIPKNNFELIQKTYDTNHMISFVLDKQNKQIKTCFSHAVLDGINFIDIVLNLTEKRFEKFNFPSNSLLKTAYSLSKLCCNYQVLNRKNQMELNHKGVFYSFVLKKENIDKIKREYNCSFMAAYQYYIFDLLSGYCKKFLIATPYGISNPCQFNSIGGIPYFLDLSLKENFQPNEIDRQIKKNSFFLMLSTSKYLKKMMGKKKKVFDIMFSSIPISREKYLSIGNNESKRYDLFMPYHSSVVYIFSGKIGDNLYVNMGVKNKGLIEYLKKYNFDILS